MRLLICWEIGYAGKFVTQQRLQRRLQTQSKLFSNLLSFSWAFFFLPTCLIFFWNAWRDRSRWCAQVIAISLSLGSLSCSFSFISLSFCTGLCSALLTNKTLRRRVEFALQKLWCIGFFTVRTAPPTAFSFAVVLRTIFSVFAIFTLSPSLPSPLRLSEYHLQFNAYLGWALTIACTMKWSRPCLHA